MKATASLGVLFRYVEQTCRTDKKSLHLRKVLFQSSTFSTVCKRLYIYCTVNIYFRFIIERSSLTTVQNSQLLGKF